MRITVMERVAIRAGIRKRDDVPLDMRAAFEFDQVCVGRA